MKRFILIIFALFLISLQAFAGSQKSTMEKIMNSWLGENLETVIKKWGYPTRTQSIADHKLYYWDKKEYYCDSYSCGEHSCNRIFEIDNSNIIIDWQWEGNWCPKTHKSAKKWLNPQNDPWLK